MSNHRRRNDRRPPWHGRRPARPAAGEAEWLWGWHPVTAALANPARAARSRLIATAERAAELIAAMAAGAPQAEILEAAEIGRLLPAGAVHQGVALLAAPLEPASLETLASPADGVLVMLDEVTDPRNVGTIFRSAAALGARGVILQERRAPALGGVLAKAAAGAVDRIAHARTVNLARALERLETMGWRSVGLEAAAPRTLAEVLDGGPTVLVLGAEHQGLRRLVREHCDAAARIEMAAGFDSLNVAAAAAVALYEAARRRG